jgi:flavin reductase (DIM6/NTAB) family NADH-FMN oxidoreductase RutF
MQARKDAGARVPLERTSGGAIVLTEAPGWAELSLRELVESGDHTVLVTKVTAIGLLEEQQEG